MNVELDTDVAVRFSEHAERIGVPMAQLLLAVAAEYLAKVEGKPMSIADCVEIVAEVTSRRAERRGRAAERDDVVAFLSARIRSRGKLTRGPLGTALDEIAAGRHVDAKGRR